MCRFTRQQPLLWGETSRYMFLQSSYTYTYTYNFSEVGYLHFFQEVHSSTKTIFLQHLILTEQLMINVFFATPTFP